MLQIASGKLFKSAPGQRNQLRGVVYTNLLLHGRAIGTEAGRLLPTDSFQNTKALVYEFTELIEQAPREGVVASHGIDPYLKDFAAIVSFALNVTCTPAHDLTSRLTSAQAGPTSSVSPQKLVRRIFDDHVFCQDEDADRLVALARDLIGLPRKSYLKAIRAIRTYVTGLHRLADDLELAYTLLVASIESLAQGFDGRSPKWAEYDETKRRAIEKALAKVDDEAANAVRNVLLKFEHVPLARQFRDFTLKHLRPSYFREEAAGLDNPVGRAELLGALAEAYSLRSRYVHNLSELPKLLTLGVDYRETTRIDHVTLLTFQGIARLARHVITEFIARQPKVKTEEYNYSGERAGIVQVPLAPKYWIGQVESLYATSGRKRLEGFLNQLAVFLLQEPNAELTDLRNVLAKVEEILPKMKKQQRLPFIALYYIFNGIVPHDHQSHNLPKIQKRYGLEIKDPSVEALLVHLVLGDRPKWTLEEHKKVHDNYFRNRDKKSGMKILRTLEAALSLELAERYRIVGDTNPASELVSFAVENHPGNAALYELEQTFEPETALDWRCVLLPKPEAT